MQPWIEFFGHVERERIYNYVWTFELACARHCWGSQILGAVSSLKQNWNEHKMRSVFNRKHLVPWVCYDMSEQYGGEHCKVDLPETPLRDIANLYSEFDVGTYDFSDPLCVKPTERSFNTVLNAYGVRDITTREEGLHAFLILKSDAQLKQIFFEIYG